jgi:RHH-type proline utilization regulon transcriptional repressor/proline dehydrogenase/delta 1-pyrroline-5-carboxylate dehydrogenase
VVGVQPFGGQGLSGTGPKAGGPLYLRRLLARRPPIVAADRSGLARLYAGWLAGAGAPALAARFDALCANSPVGRSDRLPGPVGESNVYETVPRGEVLVLAETRDGLLLGFGAALATGNGAAAPDDHLGRRVRAELPPPLAALLRLSPDWTAEKSAASVLVEGERARMLAVLETVAGFGTGIVPVSGTSAGNLDLLVHEISISINTAAAGGNASLMSLKEA